MVSIKPTIVITPGGSCPVELYSDTKSRLEAEGFEAHVVPLRSVCQPTVPAPTMYDDAAQLHDMLERQADRGRYIILVMHSYGGIPGTEATKSLSVVEREAAGKPGGIVRLLYVAGLIAPEGQSLTDLMMSYNYSYMEFEDGWVRMNPEMYTKIGFSELPPKEALECARKMQPMSPGARTGRMTWPGYKYIPSSYFLTERDRAVPPENQKMIIQILELAGGLPVDVQPYPTDHFPWNSNPDMVVECLNKLARNITSSPGLMSA